MDNSNSTGRQHVPLRYERDWKRHVNFICVSSIFLSSFYLWSNEAQKRIIAKPNLSLRINDGTKRLRNVRRFLEFQRFEWISFCYMFGLSLDSKLVNMKIVVLCMMRKILLSLICNLSWSAPSVLPTLSDSAWSATNRLHFSLERQLASIHVFPNARNWF